MRLFLAESKADFPLFIINLENFQDLSIKGKKYVELIKRRLIKLWSNIFELSSYA